MADNAVFLAAERARAANPAADLVMTAGPPQQVLRRVEIEAPTVYEQLRQGALFGPDRLFSAGLGNQRRRDGGMLSMAQERGAALRLAEDGTIGR